MVVTAETQARLEDYLNDKFQTPSDLNNIDSLLSKLQEQQDLLRQQLDEARKSLAKIESDVVDGTVALRERSQAFQDEQGGIDRQLKILTQSEVSDDAVQQFDVKMGKLRRIEVAEGYLSTIDQVNKLNVSALSQRETEPEKCVATYTRLYDLVQDLERAQAPAEGAAPHLVDSVLTTRDQLYKQIREDFERSLQRVMDRMKWPAKQLNLSQGLLNDWSHCASLLLQLQEPSLLSQTKTNVASSIQSQSTILLPLAVMVNPLVLRFRYHFYGEKPTNRLDKPEYFFSHVLDLLDQHSTLLSDLLQPILDDRIAQNDQLDLIYTDAISAFISALIPMVEQKCLSLLPQLTSQPQLLSHLIHEMMSFDATLTQSWAYSPSPGPFSNWKGLTHTILTVHDYFKSWLAVEKEFALSRYKKIRDDPASNTIDLDAIEAAQSKPTKGAIRVNDLLETITDRYRNLASFSQKMKFLLDIQLSIFDDYHSHLDGVLQVYLVSSHRVGRLIQGQGQSAEDTMGMRGLESLVKIFTSAEYLERKMSDWSDDVFFLELWEELQDRAAQHDGSTGGVVGRDLRLQDVASKTSSTIGNIDTTLESDGGGLFDETAAAYRGLRQRSETEIVRALEVSLRSAIAPFARTGIWKSLSANVSDSAQLTPSASLDSLTQTMSALLSFLSKTLAIGPLRRITRQVCTTIQREIYTNVVLANQFSAAGAMQLKRDLSAICSTIDASTQMPDEAYKHFRKIHDTLTLLTLPIKSTPREDADTNEDEADAWAFDDESGNNDTNYDLETTDTHDGAEPWGLWQAEKAIMRSNESAREALDAMGIRDLTESEARNVIRRRIEINS